MCYNHCVQFLLIIQILISVKQTDNCQSHLVSFEKNVNWNSIIKCQENICLSSSQTNKRRKKVNSQSCQMSLEEQTPLVEEETPLVEEETPLVENLKLDDVSDHNNDEAVLSKYIANKEKVGPDGDTLSSGTKESDTEKDISEANGQEENSKNVFEEITETVEKDTSPRDDSVSEKEKQSDETENDVEEEGTNNVENPQSLDIDAKASIGTETDCNNDQNLENVVLDQTNETPESSDDKNQIECTSNDLKSSQTGSYMERDTDEDMGLNNPENEHDENKQKSASDESSQQTQEDNKNEEGGWKEIKNKKDEKKNFKKRFGDIDTENYRNGYPDKKDDPKLRDNIRFYMGEIPSLPDGVFIDDFHKHWMGEYEMLERHHGYIQWLFPIRENGMNWQAQALQLHEAEAIKADPNAKKRVLQSYRLILDFYGMNLVDEETGQLERSENWKICFDNLNRSSHNYLRITRILKCLGELGYEHLKKGFIQFVLDEALEHKTLTRVLTSCRDYWIGTIKDDEDREELYGYIDRHQEENSSGTHK